MRRTLLSTIALLTVSSQWLGCSYDFCEAVTCGVGAEGAGAEGAGGEGAGGNTGGGGEGGSPPAECLPMEGEAIGADCGVFVASGATGNGSQASPYGSVTEAVSGLGQASRIYVCGGDTFTGSINLPSDVSIYGGLDCASWRFQTSNPKPEILGSPDEPAIAINGSGNGTLFSLRVRAPNAEAEGASSIAVQVSGAATTIRDCELRSSAGAVGAPGAVQAKSPTPATANGQSPPEDGCDGTTALNVGGESGLNTCNATSVAGGIGGNGTNAPDGGAGSPGSGGGGAGGKAETQSAPSACGTGGEGTAGMAGTPGPGASATDAGTLSQDGYSPPTAPAGLTAGGFGLGGGGGGGANNIGCSGAGPGGGGGGAGGCGGNPGNGGQGGGGSFALISIGGAITLDGITLSAGAGGTGGQGDAGQEGMDGGIEGAQASGGGACPGGPGGKGGQGGAGGGGRGGPSVGIAYTGDAPIETGTIEITTSATPAAGGAGGNGGGANVGGQGADGLSELRQAWP